VNRKSIATTAVENITTYFPYALIFTNHRNVFADIRPKEFLVTANVNTSGAQKSILKL
jgi:hypothetical protein